MIRFEITLDDAQLSQLAELVAEKMAARVPARALTPAEFAAATGTVSAATVRRAIKAGTLRRVPNVSKVLIPHSELEKFR